MRAALNGLLWLTPESEADHDVVDQLAGRMTFVNPDYARAKEQGAKTVGIDPSLEFFTETTTESGERLLGFPRAVVRGENWGKVVDKWAIEDERLYLDNSPGLAEATPIGLRDYQQPAVDAMFEHLRYDPSHGGVLHAPCGTGKTVMGLELARRITSPTCVLVHKTFLVDQWVERIRDFLPAAKVGFLRQDHIDWPGEHDIVIAMIQSIVSRREYPQAWFDGFGLVISDEVHRLAAPTWHRSMGRFRAAYRLGLTATPRRPDGLHKVFKAGIGNIAYEVEGARLRATLGVVRLNSEIEPRRYVQRWNNKPNIPKLVTALANLEDRTSRIVDDITKAVAAGRKPLVLTDRVAHVNAFVKALCARDIDARKFVGGMTPEQQETALTARVVIGTFAMAQEGLDCPELDTLFLATPKTSVTQAVGRILREHAGKKDPLVVDYVDQRIPICSGMYRSRSRTYAELGIERQQA